MVPAWHGGDGVLLPTLPVLGGSEWEGCLWPVVRFWVGTPEDMLAMAAVKPGQLKQAAPADRPGTGSWLWPLRMRHWGGTCGAGVCAVGQD